MTPMQFEIKYMVVSLITCSLIYLFPGYQKIAFFIIGNGGLLYLCREYYSKADNSADYWTIVVGIAFCVLGYMVPSEYGFPIMSIGISLFIRFGFSLMIAGEKENINRIIEDMSHDIEEDAKRHIAQIHAQYRNQLSQQELEERVNNVKRELEKSCDKRIAEQKRLYDQQLQKLRNDKKSSETALEQLRNEHFATVNKLESESKRMVDEATSQFKRELELRNELENAQKVIQELENKFKAIENSAIPENDAIIEEAHDLMINQMPQHYDIHLKKTKEDYPLFNNDDIVEVIANAELQYDLYTKSGGSDFSSVVAEYSKAIELILKQMIKDGVLTTTTTELTGKGKIVDKMMLRTMYNSYVKTNVGILGKDFVHNLDKFIEIRNAGVHNKIINIEQLEETKRLAVTKKSGAIIPTLHRKMKKR